MSVGRPPDYDNARWQALRREKPAAVAVLLGLLAAFAASLAWLLVLVPARTENLRLQPLAWLVMAPLGLWLLSGILSYRRRAIRLLRPVYLFTPVAAAVAALMETLNPPSRLPAGDVAVVASPSLLLGLAIVAVAAGVGGMMALRASSLDDRPSDTPPRKSHT